MDNQTSSTTQLTRPVFYSEEVGTIDLGQYRADGTLVSVYEKETLDQIRLRYPNAEVIELADACDRRDNAFKAEISEIDEETFIEALEVLPPEGWKTVDGVESFYMSERLTARVSCYYARYGKRYFTFSDVVPMPGAAIAERVKKFADA